MALAREVIENHAREDHYGLGDIDHRNRVPDSTGDLDTCDMPLDLCPHLANDPPSNNHQSEGNQTESAMSDDNQFNHLTVYIPVEIAVSDELAEQHEYERHVASVLLQVVTDALAEPESVAEHDPIAIVGVSDKTHWEPVNEGAWERVLPDPDKEVFGTVSRKPVRAADLGGMDAQQQLVNEFKKMLKFLNEQVEEGKLHGLTKVRLVLELDVPEREPAVA